MKPLPTSYYMVIYPISEYEERCDIIEARTDKDAYRVSKEKCAAPDKVTYLYEIPATQRVTDEPSHVVSSTIRLSSIESKSVWEYLNKSF